MTGYFCDFIYEFGYEDIYDRIIHCGCCSLGRVKEDRKNKTKISLHHLLRSAEIIFFPKTFRNSYNPKYCGSETSKVENF
jgi:hypothetical protein